MDSTSCHICYEQYDSQHTRPRTLPCGHTLCSGCLGRLLHLPGSSRSCPTCVRSLNSTDLESYPPNYALEAVLDLLSGQRCAASTQHIQGKVGTGVVQTGQPWLGSGSMRVRRRRLQLQNKQQAAHMPSLLTLFCARARSLARHAFSCLDPPTTTSDIIGGLVLLGCIVAVAVILSQPGRCSALMKAVQADQPSSNIITSARCVTSARRVYELINFLVLGVKCQIWCMLAIPYWCFVGFTCIMSKMAADTMSDLNDPRLDELKGVFEAWGETQCFMHFWDFFKDPFVLLAKVLVGERLCSLIARFVG